MKVKAEHWINVNGTWHKPGEVYEDGEPSETSPAPAQAEKPRAEEQQKRRPKKTAKE